MEDNIDLQNFIEKFSPKVIEKLSGLDLLKRIAYPKHTDSNIKEQFKNLYEDNYDSLKNELENGMFDCGSGSPGYDTNFVLAYRKGDWYNKTKKITFEEAIQIAEQIKQELVSACSFLDKNDFNSFYDYVSNSKSDFFMKGYTHKYFYILYPRYIAFYHSRTWQEYYRQCLKLPKTKNYYDIEKYFLDNDSSCNVGEKSRELEKKFGIPTKKTWLLTWNPNKCHWESFEEDINKVNKGINVESKYSCYSKKPRIGDRAFILKLGEDLPKGIIASGYISRKPSMDIAEHTNDNEEMNCVKIKFDKIINFNKDDILFQDILKKELPDQEWSPQESGIEIKRKVAYKLEELWRSINGSLKSLSEVNMSNENLNNIPLNQILYGPPGTGKTYNTVVKAMSIINGIEYNDVSLEQYRKLKTDFDNLKKQGQIEFVTFHQSYSYEEFVEGIKPYIPEWGETDVQDVKYVGEDGIFKKICQRAKRPIIQNDDNILGLNNNPKIWKVSLMKTGENPIRKDCMENNRIRIGFDKYGEFITDETVFNDGGSRVLSAFIDKMEIGDLVLSCYSENTIDAIGVVTSDYKWNNDFDKFKRYRDVKWLVKGLNYNILAINNGAKFTLGTVYQLNNISLKDVLDIVNNHGKIAQYKENDKKYILIIDEINRGNISKIFGELITLIEEDKREDFSVTLPYSKKTFSVPKNLYIIGTMNTSDRSIASIDIALRRRFKFKEMMSDSSLVANFGIGFSEIFEKLNTRIKVLLDRDHQIGHSYFIKTKYNDENKNNSIETLKDIFFSEIIPLLNEYFYCDWEKLQAILGNAKDDGKSFIKKVDKISFANNYSCDDDELYDFASLNDKNFDFEEALANAFSDNSKSNEKDI